MMLQRGSRVDVSPGSEYIVLHIEEGDLPPMGIGSFSYPEICTITITGMNGLNLRDLWERGPDGARAYMWYVLLEFW